MLCKHVYIEFLYAVNTPADQANHGPVMAISYIRSGRVGMLLAGQVRPCKVRQCQTITWLQWGSAMDCPARNCPFRQCWQKFRSLRG
ncbi:hypothetical protein BD413DRAFT_158504 [Trametes elegans]|nr:hypothetical protein BD413DRAFT_158504 [Trametes elegans]